MSMSVRFALVYAAFFLMLGIMLPFLPVWLKAAGLDAREIAIVLALQSVVRVVAMPLVTYRADRGGQRRATIIAGAVLALVFMAGMPFGRSVVALALLCTAAAASWAAILPMLDAMTVARSERGEIDYGRVRIAGSLAFIAGSVGAGRLLAFMPESGLIYPLIAAHALLAVLALVLPGSGRRAEPAAAPDWRGTALMVLRPGFLVFAAGAGLIQAGHAVFYGFGSLHWQALGYSGSVIGALWSTGVIAEVVLFAFSRRAVALVGPLVLIVCGGVLGAVRWAATAGDPGLEALFALQALHAASFGATHIGAMYQIRRMVPAELAATAQGTYAAISGGLLMTAAMAASGPLYAAFGGRAYLAMAGLSLTGALLALSARRLIPTATPARDA